MLNCKFCLKQYEKNSSLLQHEQRCKDNPNRKVQTGRKNKSPWNKGLTKDDHPSIARPQFIGRKWGRSLTGHPPEYKKMMRELAIKRNLGGHTSKRKLWFKKKNGEEVFLQSSYEVEFANILEELNLEWSRPAPLLWVDDNNLQHRYYPDFKVGDIFFDTKNDYLIKKDNEKITKVIEQNNVKLFVISKQNINIEHIASLV